MTHARPVRHPVSAGVAAVAVAALLSPVPGAPARAAAAPAPCEHAQRYAAESGADLFRLNRLDLRPTGRRAEPLTDVALAQTRSAMVAESAVNSAAAGRILSSQPTSGRNPGNRPATKQRSDGGRSDSGDTTALSRALQQQAPPAKPAPIRQATAAGTEGPLSVGAGMLTAHARWDPAMACGAATGGVTRAEAGLTRVDVLTGRAGGALVRVPREVGSLSTTALERRGTAVHSVARATVTAGRMDLVDGAVRVTVRRSPTLAATISAEGGAEIRYVPAVVEVSGAGFHTRRLDSAGDEVTVALGGGQPSTEAAPAVPGDPLGGLLARLPLGTWRPVPPATPLTLPGLAPRPGVPPLGASGSRPPEITGPQAVLRISLGDVRQAMAGHAVAARATAVHVEIHAGSTDRTAAGGPARGGVVLDLDVGVLEVAAVAPEPAGTGGGGDAAGGGGSAADGGASAVDVGLPVTGPRVDLVIAGGVLLLVMGFVFLMFGLRRHSFRS